MIQRKQTVFLLLAAILGVVAMSLPIASVMAEGLRTASVYSLMWVDTTPAAHFAAHYSTWPLFAMLLLASSVAVYSIFLYRRRLLQARLCVVSLLLYVAWYIGLVVVSKSLAPDAQDFNLSIVAALPAVSAILCLMARNGILADEKLVRAADRLR